MKTHEIKSRGAILAAVVVFLIAGMIFAGQDVHGAAAAGSVTDTSEEILEPAAKDGWQEDGTFYRDDVMLTGIQSIDGRLYNLDATTGQKKTDTYAAYNGKLYYFGTAGTGALYNGLYGGYYYRNGSPGTGLYKGIYYKNGTRATGIYNKRYYKSGSLGTGLYGGKCYKKGSLLTGMYKSRYYKNGVRFSGVYKSYYYTNGVKQTKYKSVVKKMNNGKIYCFQKNGKVSTKSGWKRIKGKRYYFKKGQALTGWHYVGGYKYYFDKKGKLCQDLIGRFGSKWKKKDICIKVNRRKNCVTLYAKDGKRGYTIPVKAMACSVGKAGTPTVKGTYYLSKDRTYRWAKLGGPTMGGYCYGQYCSRITGSYLFHSVNYRSPNNRTLTSSAYNNLGSPASHGCIRLQSGNAKIIYDIARNRNTKVVIYDSNSTGPFDKPVVKKISAGQNYDPTDPNIRR